jgi:2-C-methyl-D-erythritol 2,4-cyclodiphosphate synthase
MRIGHGYDAHRLHDGDHVVLGGVKIPFDRGLAAHSDGDVLLHAICDALLGAAGLGDIGQLFPDTSAEFAGVDSRILVRRVSALLGEHGFRVSNVDATLIAERPKILPHVWAMRRNIAEDLEIAVARVSIKGTTTESMGFTGRGEGIAACAVTLLDE